MARFPNLLPARKAEPVVRPANPRRSEVQKLFHQGSELLRRGRHAEAEAALRDALRHNPDDGDVLNNLGTAIWEQGRGSEAMAYYLRAYQFKPKDFSVLNNLGIALWDQNKPDRAASYYRRALEVWPNSFDAQMNLGVALSDLGEFEEALQWMRSSLKIKPDSADAWDNVGMTLARMGDWDEAMACYDKAIDLKPDFGEAHRNRALGYLTLGDFERGFAECEWRFRCRCPPGFTFLRPSWRGEPLEGRTILLHYEQGLGDTVQYIRFAPEVVRRGGRVWVFCQASMVRLISLCPYVERVFDGSVQIPDFDVHAPLLSVPAIVGTSLATLPSEPYLSADKASIERWRGIMARALGGDDPARVFKIAIAWQGNPDNRIDRWRSFPLGHLRRLAAVPGVRLFSIQKNAGTEQIRMLDGTFPVIELDRLVEGGADKRDFLDTSAIMQAADLVVVPETAVAHLGGALGAKTWVALSFVGDWRWMINRDDSPWYPSIRLFRQKTMNDWDQVFDDMAAALWQKLHAR
jgi:Tfp pilus assembly protein PilF